MNILLVVPEFPPNTVGGGGIVFKNLAQQYCKMGHNVCVMHGDYKAKSFFKKISKKTKEKINYISVPLMPYPKFGNFVTSTPASIRAFFQVAKIIRKGEYDVVHAHGVGHIFVDTCTFVSNKPIIFTVHGVPDPSNLIARLIYSLYKNTFTRLALKKANTITAVSSYTASMLRTLTNKKVVVIGNALDTGGFSVNNHIIPNSEFIIFTAGRLINMKGFDKVIEMLPKFVKKYKNVKFIIAGRDAGYKKTLIQKAKASNVSNSIEFVGYIDRKQLSNFLNKANVVAITSSKEPFNIFALEAMYFNKVILTTFGGGLKTTLGGYTKAVDINSSDIFSQIEQKQKIKSNFNYTNYCWSKIANKYLKLMRKYEEE